MAIKTRAQPAAFALADTLELFSRGMLHHNDAADELRRLCLENIELKSELHAITTKTAYCTVGAFEQFKELLEQSGIKNGPYQVGSEGNRYRSSSVPANVKEGDLLDFARRVAIVERAACEAIAKAAYEKFFAAQEIVSPKKRYGLASVDRTVRTVAYAMAAEIADDISSRSIK